MDMEKNGKDSSSGKTKKKNEEVLAAIGEERSLVESSCKTKH